MADMSGLAVTVDTRAAAVVVAIGGEIDQATAGDVEKGVDQGVTAAVERGVRRLVIQLDEVTFCGSAGLAQLVMADGAATLHGLDLVLVVTPGGMVERVLKLTDLLGMFTIVATRDQALVLPPSS